MNPIDHDWSATEQALDTRGWAVLPRLFDPSECDAITALYDEPAHFRSQVVMARHGFGRGEYRYFAYPLPDPVQALRTALIHASRQSPTAGTTGLG